MKGFHQPEHNASHNCITHSRRGKLIKISSIGQFAPHFQFRGDKGRKNCAKTFRNSAIDNKTVDDYGLCAWTGFNVVFRNVLLKDDYLCDYITIHPTIKSSDILSSPCAALGIAYADLVGSVYFNLISNHASCWELSFQFCLRMRWKAKVLEPAGTGRTWEKRGRRKFFGRYFFGEEFFEIKLSGSNGLVTTFKLYTAVLSGNQHSRDSKSPKSDVNWC